MEEKYGKAIDFNDSNLVHEDKRVPIVFTHSRKDFE
jgi:hypothetical protein